MSTNHYSKTSYSYLVIGCMSILFLGVGFSYYFQWGSSPIPLIATLLVESFFILIVVLMYKLTIRIDDKKIVVRLGIGYINKSMLLVDIDATKIKKISIPWYYGVGIRITPHGMLFNVKMGDALYIQSKNGSRTILVGTDEAELLIKIMQPLLKKQ